MRTDEFSSRVAAHGLPTRFEGESWTVAHLDRADWEQLLLSVAQHRLSGLLLEAIGRGALIASDSQAMQAAAVHRRSMAWVLLLDRKLLEVAGRLRVSGIEFRLLKGCAHAHLLYPDPSLRPYVDIDLLVRGSDFAAAVDTLRAIDISRQVPELRPGYDRRFGKGATLRTAEGFAVDLHRTFVAGPFAMTIDADRLFETVEFVAVGGDALPALAREERFLHACFNATVSDRDPTFIALRDVAAAALDTELDFDRAVELARRWGAGLVVATALRTSWAELGLRSVGQPVAWTQSYRDTARERRVLQAYKEPDRRWRSQALAALPEIAGLGSKIAYLRATLLPSKEARQARGRSMLGHIKRGFADGQKVSSSPVSRI